MSEDAGAFFRTTDMTLAAVLACKGYTYRVEALSSSSGAWVFHQPVDEEEFDDVVNDYRDLVTRVEPRAFAAELATVRKKMYQLLGVQANAKSRLNAPAPEPR